MASPGSFAFGFLAAMLLVSVISHWAALLGTVLGRHGGDFLGPPKRRLLWAAPLAMVHPAPFLMAAALTGGVMAGLVLLERSWEWFFAGLYSALAYFGWFASIAWRRSRARRAGRESRS